MKENRFLYAVRFIAALAVITIHTRFPGRSGEALDALARFAVPFFFAISGRFLLGDEGPFRDDREYIRIRTFRALVRLLKMTALVYLSYLAFSFVYHTLNGVSVSEWLSSKFNGAEAFAFFLFNSGKFIYDGSYTFDHLWYLFALIYVYVLIILFASVLKKWSKWLAPLLLALMFFGELLQTVYPIRPFGINICTWYVLRNWLLVGMPFVLIGIIFSDYIGKKKAILSGAELSVWQRRMGIASSASLLIGIVATVAERFIFGKKEVHIGSVIIVIALLYLSECRPYWGGPLSEIGKKASGNIYFFHVMVIAVLDILTVNGILPILPMWLKPLVIMVLCVVCFYYIPEFNTLKGKRKNEP